MPRTFQIDRRCRCGRHHGQAPRPSSSTRPTTPWAAVYAEQRRWQTLRPPSDDAEERLGTRAAHLRGLDEPYREIAYGAEVPWVPAIYDRTIVCYSYSKSLSLPGERIGWVLVPNTNPLTTTSVDARRLPALARKLGFVCAPAIFQRVVDRLRGRAHRTSRPTPSNRRAAAPRALSATTATSYVEPQAARSTCGSRRLSPTPTRSSSGRASHELFACAVRLLRLPGLGPRRLLREPRDHRQLDAGMEEARRVVQVGIKKPRLSTQPAGPACLRWRAFFCQIRQAEPSHSRQIRQAENTRPGPWFWATRSHVALFLTGRAGSCKLASGWDQ